MTNIPRPEYPRPQFARNDWLNLNGMWWFNYDDNDIGIREKWYEALPLVNVINVPFAYQSPLSGIHETAIHDIVWYQRDFQIPEDWLNRHVWLHFGAVDYETWVWINGQFVIHHIGGHTPFCADITNYLHESTNQVAVRVMDISNDLGQPRGKQHWEQHPNGIFYTRTTGIWQTIWLEPVSERHLEHLRITPHVDSGEIQLEYQVVGTKPTEVEIETHILPGDDRVASVTHSLDAFQQDVNQTIPLGLKQPVRLWSPEDPVLYDVVIRLRRTTSEILDEVRSYFGLRTVSTDAGKFKLNNRPYYQKLVIDQGYHPDGLLTYPDDETIKHDIELTKAFGFNGVRKRQIIADPRYLYWADKLGLLVWGEMPNAYTFSDRTMQQMIDEWQTAVRRDYNHPCIIAWVPVNESWGVPALKSSQRQRHHLHTLVYLTKSLDPTRPVISNDGWEHAGSDIVTLHDYTPDANLLQHRYSTVAGTLNYKPGSGNKSLFATGHAYQGQPLILSEFGGIVYPTGEQNGWGHITVNTSQALIKHYEELVTAIRQSPHLQGFCYMQLTDVEQELNGLLTYDRQPKVDPALIYAINNPENKPKPAVEEG